MDKETNSIELRYELYDKNCHVIDASVESEGVVVFLQSVNWITSSIIPSSCKSSAVRRMISAASFARLLSFHKILAKPSGDNTE